MIDPSTFDVPTLVEAYRARRLSPREVMAGLLARAETTGGPLRAFVLVDPDQALAAASASEARWAQGQPMGPLDGVPFTVKDNIAWAGHPMRRGSLTSPDGPVAESSPAVDRLLEAGAIPWAKTTLPEFGWKGVGDSRLSGVPLNPWDTSRTPGGSSAGAAIAAAIGLGPLHLGTDGAGSIRIPAAFCGLFGIKPSFGRVPNYPPSAFAIVSHVGPLTRTVTDAAIMLGTIGAPDPRDINALVTPAQDYLAGLEIGVKGLRVAWSPRLGGQVERIDPEVEELAEAGAQVFAELGAEVVRADPDLPPALPVLTTLWRTGAWSVLRTIPESRWGEIDPGFVAIATAGREISGADYVAAANARSALSLAMARFHERYDLLLTPTVATVAVEAGRDTPADGRFGADWLAWTPYTYPFNLTLQPAASVPCGLTGTGLPVGLQIVGPMLRDGSVLRAARAYEKARPWPSLAEAYRPG
ncbi:MAG: amidase [Methylobacteriaceae bacterium]|nr:amidase [Methylobacteriaceae bacterium]